MPKAFFMIPGGAKDHASANRQEYCAWSAADEKQRKVGHTEIKEKGE